MGTTTKGIWYPDANIIMNPLQTQFSTMAQSVDDLLDDPDKTRTVRHFASTGARDAAIPAPQVGMLAATGSGSSQRLWMYGGGSWSWNPVDSWEAEEQGYTPSLGLSEGWSLGNGTLSGQYYRRGKLVFVAIELNFGTTTVAGAGWLRLTLPLPSATAISSFSGAHIPQTATLLPLSGRQLDNEGVYPILPNGTITSLNVGSAPETLKLSGFYFSHYT